MSNQQFLLTLLLLQIMQRLRPPRPSPGVPAAPIPVAPAASPGERSRPPGSMLPPMRAAQTLSPRRPYAGQALALGGSPVPTYLVCEAQGLPVGRVRVSPSGREAIHIEDLSVREPFRGRGAGAWLLGAALQLGQRWGRGKVWLEADDQGSGRLLAWYQRHGFQLAGKGPHGRPVLATRAARALPVIRRERDNQAGERPSYTLRAVPANSAARIHP